MKFCDLHTHSVFSDGTYTPAGIIDGAINAGLDAVALTDHNTADGLADFIAYARGKGIDAVAGVEFSADYYEKELHILGLFVPEKSFLKVGELMKAVSDRKEQSNIDLINALSNAGICLDYDEIKGKTPNGRVNRAHIAAAMTEKGYVGSIKQAFDKWLLPSVGYYKMPQRPSAFEIIDFILEIGAVPVLAHPFLNLSEEELLRFLPEAKMRGLAGMECYYSTYDKATTERSVSIADAIGLLPSGGSDFHGANKPDIVLGKGKGDLRVPYEWFERLMNSK